MIYCQKTLAKHRSNWLSEVWRSKCRWSLCTAAEEGVQASWLIRGPKCQISSCIKKYTSQSQMVSAGELYGWEEELVPSYPGEGEWHHWRTSIPGGKGMLASVSSWNIVWRKGQGIRTHSGKENSYESRMAVMWINIQFILEQQWQ